VTAGEPAQDRLFPLAAVSDDWVCKGLVEMQFDVLRDMIRDFARCQLCVDPAAAADPDD
jgi:hypothetical protein